MSLYNSIGISVQGANPARATEIKEAAEAEWPFDVDDWEPCGDPDDLTAFQASATGNLCAVLTEQELAHRLIRAIWVANGGYCEVGVSATRLTDMPYEEYQLGRDDFERMIAGRPPAEPDPGHLTQQQRFVLYDFDMGDLVSTRVYDDAAEAAEDADLLDNVMVVGFTLEHVPGRSLAEKEGA